MGDVQEGRQLGMVGTAVGQASGEAREPAVNGPSGREVGVQAGRQVDPCRLERIQNPQHMPLLDLD